MSYLLVYGYISISDMRHPANGVWLLTQPESESVQQSLEISKSLLYRSISNAFDLESEDIKVVTSIGYCGHESIPGINPDDLVTDKPFPCKKVSATYERHQIHFDNDCADMLTSDLVNILAKRIALTPGDRMTGDYWISEMKRRSKDILQEAKTANAEQTKTLIDGQVAKITKAITGAINKKARKSSPELMRL